MNDTPNPANLTKIVEGFHLRDKSLQDMTFDTVLTISKICSLLNIACTRDDRLHENNHLGK